MAEGHGLSPAAVGALLKGDIENFIVAATPGVIKRQEKDGQTSFVESDTLPIDCNFSSREIFEGMGIIYGQQVDSLFVNVQLPEGWKKIPTNHSMWSHLVDEQGRVRAQIFYKAAFYDRRAHINANGRFGYHDRPAYGYESDEYDYKTSACIGVVVDQGEIIWQSDPKTPSAENPAYECAIQCMAVAKDWLESHYPDWRNPLAYWETD